MPMKPCKFGIKIWVVADPKTGYCFKFEPYEGAKVPDRHAGTAGLVMDLMGDLLDQNRVVCCDRWFTSVDLAVKLLERNTYLLGTVRLPFLFLCGVRVSSFCPHVFSNSF